MKNSNRFSRLQFFAVVIVGSFYSLTAQANLIINGGFEEPIVISVSSDPLDHWERRYGTELTGWTTPGGVVQFDSLYSPVTDGNQAVQLERPNASINQSFATVAGQTYQVSFDLSAFGVGYGYVSTLGVSIGPVTQAFSGSYLSYAHHAIEFSADAATTTLEFKNIGADGTYPHIDSVSVSGVAPVPVPATFWLFGSGLIGLLGILRRS